MKQIGVVKLIIEDRITPHKTKSVRVLQGATKILLVILIFLIHSKQRDISRKLTNVKKHEFSRSTTLNLLTSCPKIRYICLVYFGIYR